MGLTSAKVHNIDYLVVQDFCITRFIAYTDDRYLSIVHLPWIQIKLTENRQKVLRPSPLSMENLIYIDGTNIGGVRQDSN